MRTWAGILDSVRGGQHPRSHLTRATPGGHHGYQRDYHSVPRQAQNGSWGARVTGAVAVGDEITITTRAGKSWTAIVDCVIWSGSGVSICATSSADRPQRTSYTPRTSYTRQRTGGEDSCGYPCPVTGQRCTDSNPCHDCQ